MDSLTFPFKKIVFNQIVSICENIFNKSCLCVYSFITTDEVTTVEYSENTLDEVEVANNDV